MFFLLLLSFLISVRVVASTFAFLGETSVDKFCNANNCCGAGAG